MILIIHCERRSKVYDFYRARANPTRCSFGQAIKEHGLLRYDAPTFVMALAFADDAFLHFRTPAQLWSFRPRNKSEPFVAKFKKEKLKEPVFKIATRAEGTTSRVLTATKFDHSFGRDSERAGYMHKFTVHALRRYFANKADGKLSSPQLPASRQGSVAHGKHDRDIQL
jgi:hypothetical protein